MDEHRFDQWSRRLAGVRTRRQALKAIAGVVAASVVGARAADAQSCTPHYSPCQGDGQCCSGAVCEYGLCMPGCRIDGAFTSAWMSPPGDVCKQCLPDISTTGWSPANEGMSCWSGDPNAGITTCQSGTCQGTGPVDCRPLTACHTATINPSTGQCVQSFAAAGTPCGGTAMCYGDLFTPADTCDGAGFCIGGGSQTRSCAPYKCGQGACTTSCVSDADCASGAHCDDGACFPDADLGQPCDEDSDCQSGICAEGVCCTQRCEGLCETCVGTNPGVCSPVICDDGLSCTTGVCNEQTGACSHTLNPGTCLIAGECAPAGTVNPSNACQVCDPTADPHAWSAVVCPDDALSCTTATCDPTSGCRHTLQPGFCLIDGVCYDDEAVNPANACELCDADGDPDGWSAVVCPDDALSCTTATCDPATGCGQTLNPGFCLIAGECYAAGEASPGNACQVCDPTADLDGWTARVCDDALPCTTATCDPETGCEQTINAGSCLIGGVCYDDEAVNPANACQLCDAAADPDGWSAVVCSDDALSCTTATCDPDTGCGQTINPGTCLIDGACYDDETVNPENACQVCNAAANATGWSPVVCPDDTLICTTTTCDPDTGCSQTIRPTFCVIAGVCYGVGTINPDNPCLVCDVEKDAEGWSDGMCSGGVCSNGLCVTSISGEFSPDGPRGYVRCNSDAARPYHFYTFTHAGGPLQLGMSGASGGGGTLNDALLALYTSYNPADTCANMIIEDDDGGCGLDAHIEIADLDAGTYTVLAMPILSRDPRADFGTYTLTFGQDPAC